MISLINFQDHPTNRNMKVFFFKQEVHASYFENMLHERGIPYEKQIDEEGDHTIYYGVGITHFEEVKKINYLTIGAHRKPFIPDAFFRYFLILLTFVIIGLAITGAILSN